MSEDLFVDCIRLKIRDGAAESLVYLSKTAMKNFDPDFSLEHNESFELNQVPNYVEIFKFIETGQWHMDYISVRGFCATAKMFRLYSLEKFIKKTFFESSSDGKVELTTANYHRFREACPDFDTPRSELSSPTSFATQSNASFDQPYRGISSPPPYEADTPMPEHASPTIEEDFVTASFEQSSEPSSSPAPSPAFVSPVPAKHPVSLLQEYCVAKFLPTPKYIHSLLSNGEHEVECHVNDMVTKALDRTKTKAQRDAATKMLKNLAGEELNEPEVDQIKTLETEINFFYSKLRDRHDKQIEAFKRVQSDDGRSGTGQVFSI